MSQPQSLRRALVALSLSVFLLGGLNVSAASTITDSKSSTPIEQAEQAYKVGDYQQTIDLLQKHLRGKDTTPLAQVTAYRLLSLAYIAQGDMTNARTASDNLIRIFPSYELSDSDSDEFAALVVESQQRYADGALVREKKKGGVPQFVYTGIAVVTSAVVLYVGATSM